MHDWHARIVTGDTGEAGQYGAEVFGLDAL
jgi:hypothetical protein